LAGQVAILADDLTGALDAAAGFASSTSPVQAVWASRDIRDGVGFSIDSETRDVPASEAEAKVADLLPRLLAGGIRYKKIDSLLRGNTVAEIAVCGTNRAFGSLVIAPAFPAQNRITRGGRQYARLSGRWGRVGPSIGDELRTRAVPSRLLARGLAGLRSPAILPPAASALALIGSRHPMSVRQVRHLAEAFPEAVVTLDSLAGARAAVASLAARLQKHGRAALAFELPVLARNAVNALLNTVFAAIVRAIDPPGRVIIGGGDTLMRLAAAAGAARLETVGEWRAGIPLSYFPNGRWQGTAVLSKSGAFGDERTLTEALGLVESRVP
jgi:uncharacterized protein YgbK (DUF1537 family)